MTDSIWHTRFWDRPKRGLLDCKFRPFSLVWFLTLPQRSSTYNSVLDFYDSLTTWACDSGILYFLFNIWTNPFMINSGRHSHKIKLQTRYSYFFYFYKIVLIYNADTQVLSVLFLFFGVFFLTFKKLHVCVFFYSSNELFWLFLSVVCPSVNTSLWESQIQF